jgi:hypothetical protein
MGEKSTFGLRFASTFDFAMAMAPAAASATVIAAASARALMPSLIEPSARYCTRRAELPAEQN